MVSHGIPNALVGVRFLHPPQKSNLFDFYLEDSNGGVMFCQQAKPRAGAQTNLSDGENLVEGDLLHP